MSTTSTNNDTATFISSFAAILTLFVVAFPLGLPVAVWAWRWRRDNARDWRTVIWPLAGSAVALAAFTLLALHSYLADWLTIAHAITKTPGGEAILPALARMAPLSVPAGVITGVCARDAYIAHRKRHPIEGRAIRDKELERDRAHRARVGMKSPLPLTRDGDPILGVHLDGDPDQAWVKGRMLALPASASHIVAIGATGAGKTQSILRLAAAHLELGWRVIVIDAKEDYDTSRDFHQLACANGIPDTRVRVWPSAGPVDLFRGNPTAIRDRLMACAGYTEPYYRAVAGTLLTLVTKDTPAPGSLTEVVSRLDQNALKSRWAGTDNAAVAAGLKPDDVQGVRYRYYDLDRQLVSIGAVAQVRGGWSWEDADATWVTLPTSTRADAAAAFGRALLVDLIGYIRDRSRRDDRPILLIVEELGAIVSGDPETARLVIEAFERARSANVRTIVSVQTPEGLGQPDAQARILHSGASILAHRMPAPEIISNLLGTGYGLEASLGVDRQGVLLDAGSLREQSQYVLSPNALRRLEIGQAVFIHGHKWSHVAVAKVT
jgi:hypothetical protein